VKIRVGAADLHGFIPDDRDGASDRPPMEFDERRFTLGIDEAEGVHAEAFDIAVGARDGAI